MHVYCITNNINDKIYVGQHSKDDLEAYLHLNIRSAQSEARGKVNLYRAIRKYGTDAFTIQSLVKPLDKGRMDWWETFFIQILGSQTPEIGYNISAGGGGTLGYKHTPETKQMLSKLQTGRPSSQKGVPMSEAQKVKLRYAALKREPPSESARAAMSAAAKGRIFSDEHRLNLSEAGRRRIYSDDTRKKMSESQRGHIPWNKGLKLSEDQIRKGYKHSEETIQKLSAARMGKTPWNKGMKKGAPCQNPTLV